MVKTERQKQKQTVKQVVQVVITDKVFGRQKRRGNNAKGRKRLPRRSRIVPQYHIRYNNQTPAVQSWYGMKDVLNRLDIKEAQGLVGRGRREQLEPALRAEQRAVRERQERGFAPPQPSRQSQEEQYQRELAQQKFAERSLSDPSIAQDERRSEATTIDVVGSGSRMRRLVEAGAGTGLRKPQPPSRRTLTRTPREFEEVVLAEGREKVRQADIEVQLQRQRREERAERRASASLPPTESRDLARSDFSYHRDASSVARLPPPDIFQRAGQEVVAPIGEE